MLTTIDAKPERGASMTRSAFQEIGSGLAGAVLCHFPSEDFECLLSVPASESDDDAWKWPVRALLWNWQPTPEQSAIALGELGLLTANPAIEIPLEAVLRY